MYLKMRIPYVDNEQIMYAERSVGPFANQTRAESWSHQLMAKPWNYAGVLGPTTWLSEHRFVGRNFSPTETFLDIFCTLGGPRKVSLWKRVLQGFRRRRQ